MNDFIYQLQTTPTIILIKFYETLLAFTKITNTFSQIDYYDDIMWEKSVKSLDLNDGNEKLFPDTLTQSQLHGEHFATIGTLGAH